MEGATEKQPQNNEKFQEFIFAHTQEIQQRPGESGDALHERLRPYVINSFIVIEASTRIRTPSWYSFDLERIGITEGVAVCTSTCKHETPLQIFIGLRKEGWRSDLSIKSDTSLVSDENFMFEYTLFPFGRSLTEAEKNQIYDLM